MESVTTTENLKREIGTRSLALAIANIMVGSGIFVLPALLAISLGASAILAYFVCGALIFLIGLCFAEVGSRTSTSGGAYTYIESAFGPYAGFMANNIFWLGGCVVSDAAIANALADTMKFFIPAISIEMVRILFLFLLFAGLALLNIRSVKSGLRLIELAALGKLIPFILLIILGASLIDPANLKWTFTPGVGAVGSASLLLFFAFLGLEGPLSNGGEIKNPRKTVPLGIFIGIIGVLVLYIALQLLVQGVFGANMAAHKDTPLADVAGLLFGKTGSILIVVATAIAILGSLAGEIMSIPRILFAGARDGLMPKALARVHPRYATPHIAIAVYTFLGFILAISGGFKQLATIASAAVLLIYLGVVLASMKLRRTDTANSQKSFRVPGGLLVPLLATAGILWLLSGLAKPELIGMGVFVVIFSAIYGVMIVVKKKKNTVLK